MSRTLPQLDRRCQTTAKRTGEQCRNKACFDHEGRLYCQIHRPFLGKPKRIWGFGCKEVDGHLVSVIIYEDERGRPI